MKKADVLKTMRADTIPAGESGLWIIRKRKMGGVPHGGFGRAVAIGDYTILNRLTNDSLYQGGEVVMEDTEPELLKHMNFIMRARGRVLVTGLGLGCVVRGLLCNPDVRRVDVIEKSHDVLKLVKPYMNPSGGRLDIVEADALEFSMDARCAGRFYDFAWHDIWSDPDREEPHLQALHVNLFMMWHTRCKVQGAWAMPNFLRNKMREIYGKAAII